MTRTEVRIDPIYIDLPTVAAIVSLSEAKVQEMVREEQFPRPRQLSQRRVAWLYREVQDWAEQRPPSDLPPPPNTGAKKPRDKVSAAPDPQGSPRAS